MAQTKRKRRTKHRGNAAGMVEARGRTSRGGAAGAKPGGRLLKANRFNRPPSWKSAINRAGIATLLFIVVVSVIGQPVGTAIAIGGFMFLMYVPLGYYTDSWIYKRRQRAKPADKV
jgi:hypothetical protein